MNLPMIPMLFRAKAREVLKKNLSTALMVSFLAALPGLLIQIYGQAATRDLTQLLRYYTLTLDDAMANGASQQALLNLMHNAGTELLSKLTPSVVLSFWLSLISALVTPVLALGLTAYLLKIARGQQGVANDVLSRISCFFKVIGQNILIFVKLVLWSLPGIALCLACAYAFAMSNAQNNLLLYLYVFSIFVPMALIIRAALHYSMSSMVLADEPDTGVFASVKRSIELMRTHKMDYVRLYLSFILWNLAAGWVSAILGSMIPVLGTAVSMAFQLALGLYISMSEVLFYLQLKGEISLMPNVTTIMGGDQQTDVLNDDELNDDPDDDTADDDDPQNGSN